MSSPAIYRFSAAVLLSGGVLAIMGQLLEISADPSSQLWIPASWLALGGTLLVLLGLPGLYLRQADRAGRLGMVGFVLTFVALLILVGVQTFDAFVSPTLAANAATSSFVDREAIPALLGFELLGGLLLIVGPLLLGIASVRAGAFPTWAGIMLIVGSVSTLITVVLHDWNEVSAAILYLAFACFGLLLWSKRALPDQVETVPSSSVTKEVHRQSNVLN